MYAETDMFLSLSIFLQYFDSKYAPTFIKENPTTCASKIILKMKLVIIICPSTSDYESHVRIYNKRNFELIFTFSNFYFSDFEAVDLLEGKQTIVCMALLKELQCVEIVEDNQNNFKSLSFPTI